MNDTYSFASKVVIYIHEDIITIRKNILDYPTILHTSMTELI